LFPNTQPALAAGTPRWLDRAGQGIGLSCRLGSHDHSRRLLLSYDYATAARQRSAAKAEAPTSLRDVPSEGIRNIPQRTSTEVPPPVAAPPRPAAPLTLPPSIIHFAASQALSVTDATLPAPQIHRSHIRNSPDPLRPPRPFP